MRELAFFSSLGLSIAFSIFIGTFAGYYLDKWLGTHPWLMLIGFIFGVAAGFSNILLAIKRINRSN